MDSNWVVPAANHAAAANVWHELREEERAGRDGLSSTEIETLKCGRALPLDGAVRTVLAFCINFYWPRRTTKSVWLCIRISCLWPFWTENMEFDVRFLLPRAYCHFLKASRTGHITSSRQILHSIRNLPLLILII